MDFTVTLSEKVNVLPFEVLKQDKDLVIMLVNYYILKGEEVNEEQTERKVIKKKSTHNDGFWDF